ncbi:uncharacterized protein (TIGR03083 family) [Kribbella orskensis]|uniref:Uncharacterized protein (TIGR03083 family) n=1 Tax=Kribbella orskensis TaxID=2512216 RepID=A0ABY2BHP5_9ACTN|nr:MULTISPECIES: maleylpyruvate isomerase family mycothiol-dependent enzyme [Kribbella]TCN38648.1 uncharacterized protein (TIGR03083 family) [Kribbella sp. VKM Ac-2500]TCO20829.1 uncharacterized protein (TIGR03083 family) [Kribbella orskensis]
MPDPTSSPAPRRPDPSGRPGVADFLAEFERTAAELAAAFAEVDPAATVPSCPGWTVADLAAHMVSGERWAASILLSGKRQSVPAVLRTTSWSDQYAGTSAALAAAIRAVDPDEPCWNFAPVDQRAGFWSRRRLHETTVHLADAIQAGGGVAVIPPAVAADGVDEVFGVFLPRMLARGAAPAAETQLGVRAVDTGHEWTLTPARPGEPPAIDRAKATGVAVISGTASDLDLCLWKRLPATTLTIEGDTTAALAFLAGRATP